MLKIAFDKIFKHPLVKKHRFPMVKYELLEQLLSEGTCSTNNFSPSDIDEKVILETHSSEYYQRLTNFQLDKKELRAIGFPMSDVLIKEKKIIQGTLECSLHALKNGVSMNIAGGTHHAFSDRAGVLYSKRSICSYKLFINNSYCKRILILDLDVHQGNGTAEIFSSNKNVFTASFHGQKNYPFRKEKSDYDFGFEDGVTDKYYLSVIQNEIPRLIDSFKPDFIFYLSGVDIIENDK